MMRLDSTIRTALVAMAAAVFCLAPGSPYAQSKTLRLVNIAPLVWIENKPSGEQIRHEAYQANVEAYPDASVADMNAFAERLFSEQIRALAVRDRKTQVWVTFYVERIVVAGEERFKTYRRVYAREGEGWRPL